jgi:hypothetical protein
VGRNLVRSAARSRGLRLVFGASFEKLEKVARDGRGLLLSHLRVHVGVGGGDAGLAGLPACPREAEEGEQSVGRQIGAEDENCLRLPR